jgi:starch-binding outer membrane protein, SusD/RagB family
MKKHNLYIAGLFTVLFSAMSCSDNFLQVEPKVNQTEANFYKTEEHAMAALVAVYDALAVQPWIFVPIQSDIVSDDTYTGGEPGGGMGQWQEQERSIISRENSAALDLWNKCYSGIYRANLYLFKEKDIEWKDQEKRKRMKAEVLALRAYFYWDLARHYGSVPLIKATITDPEAHKSIPQASVAEVYKFIAEDLLAAIPDLPLTVPAAEKGRITKDVPRVLMARIFLFYQGFVKPVLGVTEDWSDGQTTITEAYVADMVDEIITSNRYQLLSDYAQVFDWGNENNAESIFEWQYSEKAISNDWGGWGIDGNFSVVFVGVRDPQGDPTIGKGWSFSTLSWSLVEEFEDGDPRKDVTVYDANAKLTKYTKGFQNTGFFNYKYMPRTEFLPSTQGTQDHNWPINYKDMRFAEVLLIGAELFLNSDPAKAADYLSDVRERAMGAGARKTSITIDDIYHERRVELACEGHRKWDLLRRGLDYAKEKIDASWDVPSDVPNPNDFQGRMFDVNTWGMLPIPASEIRLANPGMLQQVVPAFQ